MNKFSNEMLAILAEMDEIEMESGSYLGYAHNTYEGDNSFDESSFSLSVESGWNTSVECEY